MKETPKQENKRILFNITEVMELAKKYQQMHHSDDMDDYSHGIVDGIECVLFLMERCEE